MVERSWDRSTVDQEPFSCASVRQSAQEGHTAATSTSCRHQHKAERDAIDLQLESILDTWDDEFPGGESVTVAGLEPCTLAPTITSNEQSPTTSGQGQGRKSSGSRCEKLAEVM